MAIGMKPLNFKAGVPKLNSELGSSSSARATVISTATQTRSKGSAAHIITVSSTAHTSGNIFFTASSWGHRPRPISGRDMSLAANYRRAAGQRFNAYAQRYWNTGSLSAYNNAQVAYKQSTASSIGEALGALAGLVTTGANAYKTLNEAGVFNKKTKAPGSTPNNKPSQQLDNAVNQLSGNYTPANIKPPSAEVQGYINDMASCNDAESLKTAITVANGEAKALESATSTYQEAVDMAEADRSKLSGELNSCQAQTNTAQNNVGTAKQGVAAAEKGVKQETDALKQINADYGQAVEAYNDAHNNLVDVQNEIQRADANVKDTTSKHEEAKTNTANAKASCQAAEQAWQSCPDKIAGPNGTQIPNPQKSQLKAKFEIEKQKLKQAEQQESNAKIAQQSAEKELKAAQGKEKEAKAAEEKALQAKNKAYDKLGDQKEKIDAQEAKVQQQQRLLDKQKETLESYQEALDKSNNNLAIVCEKLEGCDSYKQMLEQHNSSITQLKDSINAQEQRLGTLEKGGGGNSGNTVSDNQTPVANNATPPKPQGSNQTGNQDIASIDREIHSLQSKLDVVKNFSPQDAQQLQDQIDSLNRQKQNIYNQSTQNVGAERMSRMTEHTSFGN